MGGSHIESDEFFSTIYGEDVGNMTNKKHIEKGSNKNKKSKGSNSNSNGSRKKNSKGFNSNSNSNSKGYKSNSKSKSNQKKNHENTSFKRRNKKTEQEQGSVVVSAKVVPDEFPKSSIESNSNVVDASDLEQKLLSDAQSRFSPSQHNPINVMFQPMMFDDQFSIPNFNSFGYPSASPTIDPPLPQIRSTPLDLGFMNHQSPPLMQNNGFDYTNIYVDNLPDDITVAHLQSLFKPFGEILSSIVMLDSTGLSLGYGFVRFGNPEQAAMACSVMNNKQLGNNTLVVRLSNAARTSSYRGNGGFSQTDPPTNLYVKPLKNNITEVDLRDEFSKFGEIQDCTTIIDKATGLCRGIGFVRFSKKEESDKAIKGLSGKPNHLTPVNVELIVKYAESTEERSKRRDAQRVFESQTFFQNPPPTIYNNLDMNTNQLERDDAGHLFVYHLPNHIDDTGLLKLFEIFGPVYNAKVMFDRNTGESRGFGFVDFTTKRDGIVAVEKMNGFKCGNKHLSVTFKKDKN